MKRYQVTPKAGPLVAGRNNNGVGTILRLTDREAAHDVRVGALIDMDEQAKPATGKRKDKRAESKTAAQGQEPGTENE